MSFLLSCGFCLVFLPFCLSSSIKENLARRGSGRSEALRSPEGGALRASAGRNPHRAPNRGLRPSATSAFLLPLLECASKPIRFAPGLDDVSAIRHAIQQRLA